MIRDRHGNRGLLRLFLHHDVASALSDCAETVCGKNGADLCA
jgi:hypothetical protein